MGGCASPSQVRQEAVIDKPCLAWERCPSVFYCTRIGRVCDPDVEEQRARDV